MFRDSELIVALTFKCCLSDLSKTVPRYIFLSTNYGNKTEWLRKMCLFAHGKDADAGIFREINYCKVYCRHLHNRQFNRNINNYPL